MQDQAWMNILIFVVFLRLNFFLGDQRETREEESQQGRRPWGEKEEGRCGVDPPGRGEMIIKKKWWERKRGIVSSTDGELKKEGRLSLIRCSSHPVAPVEVRGSADWHSLRF